MTSMIHRQISSKNYPILIKLTLICFFFLILLFFVFRPSYSPTSNQLSKTEIVQSVNQNQQPCKDLPASVSKSLIHYATSNITPQQTLKEISITERVLRQKSPCNFLVFGLGHDSLLWSSLNPGGRTLFLEEDAAWIKQISAEFPDLNSLHVSYDTKVRQADELLQSAGSACGKAVDPRESECVLALRKLPEEVYDVEWDVIMVDAPTGYHDDAPGRMTAIYTAGLMARNRRSGETDVMVHDVDRTVEDRFSRVFLCEGYLKEQEGRLRHFVLPSHRDHPDKPFCPESHH